jgi:hypothetical protein
MMVMLWCAVACIVTRGQAAPASGRSDGRTVGAQLAAAARARVADILDPSRSAVLLPVLDNDTTPVQALAVNQLLGVCGIPGWPTNHSGEMGAAKGMCRVATERPWAFPFDHGLHCNMVNEWYFFVGTFDLGETVIGIEFMFSFEKLQPDPECSCEYDARNSSSGGSSFDGRGSPLRSGDASGRLAEVQFAVVVAPKVRVTGCSRVRTCHQLSTAPIFSCPGTVPCVM